MQIVCPKCGDGVLSVVFGGDSYSIDHRTGDIFGYEAVRDDLRFIVCLNCSAIFLEGDLGLRYDGEAFRYHA